MGCMTSDHALPVARAERQALCDTLLELGPDAPTLCSPWRTRDLAAHIAVREGRPDLAMGTWLPFLSARTEHARARLAEGDYAALVEQVRTGPPRWSPLRLPRLDAIVNTSELIVHHEDVLRGDGAVGPRREVPDRTARAALKTVGATARLAFRRSPVGVRLVAPGAEPVTAGPESPVVTVSGDPVELLLVGAGRLRVAAVELEGAPEDVEALRGAELGLS